MLICMVFACVVDRELSLAQYQSRILIVPLQPGPYSLLPTSVRDISISLKCSGESPWKHSWLCSYPADHLLEAAPSGPATLSAADTHSEPLLFLIVSPILASPTGSFSRQQPGEAYRTKPTSCHCCLSAVASPLPHEETQTLISNSWPRSPYRTYLYVYLPMASPSTILLQLPWLQDIFPQYSCSVTQGFGFGQVLNPEHLQLTPSLPLGVHQIASQHKDLP